MNVKAGDILYCTSMETCILVFHRTGNRLYAVHLGSGALLDYGDAEEYLNKEVRVGSKLLVGNSKDFDSIICSKLDI